MSVGSAQRSTPHEDRHACIITRRFVRRDAHFRPHRLTVSTAKASAYRAGRGIAGIGGLPVGAGRRCLTGIALRRGGLTRGATSGRLTASSGRLAGRRLARLGRIALLRGIAVRRLTVRAGRRGLTPLTGGGLTGGRVACGGAGTWCWRGWISAWRGAARCELVRPGRCAEAEARSEERASHGRRGRRTLLRCHGKCECRKHVLGGFWLSNLKMPATRARQ